MTEDSGAVALPEAYLDLFEGRALGHLATIMPDGSPQVTPVWIDREGSFLLVNTAKGRVKSDNMERRPHVAVEVMDGAQPYRYLSVRGRVVEAIEGDRAEAHIDALARRYLGVDAYPETNRAPGEKRVIFKIEPTSVHGFGSAD